MMEKISIKSTARKESGGADFVLLGGYKENE